MSSSTPTKLSRSPRSGGHAFSRFVAIFTRERSSASQRRVGENGPEDLSRMRYGGWNRRADGAERNGGGEASTELINSDGLLSTRPFERQRVIMSVFVEGKSSCPSLGWEKSHRGLISSEQSLIQ